jgi:hypothetical protein
MLGDESSHRFERHASIPEFHFLVFRSHNQPANDTASRRHPTLDAGDLWPSDETGSIPWWTSADDDA